MTPSPNDPPGFGIVAQTPGSNDSQTGHIALPMVINILLQFHDDIHLFTRATGEFSFDHPDVHVHKFSKPFADSGWYLRLPGQVIYQVKYALAFVRYRGRVDIALFRGSGFIIPMITAKLLGTCVLSKVGGVIWRQEDTAADSVANRIWVGFLKRLQFTLHRIADVLVLISPYSATFAQVERFDYKSHVWCHYYFDLEKFSVTTPFSKRDDVVGQVAELSEIKGTLQLVSAMEGVNRESGYRLLLVGDGPVYEDSKSRCAELGIDAEFTGRVDRDEVPRHLNRMKLHVMCSVSEGLPKAAIEAMACGTPVLATRVGGLADIIEDGENGFLIESNDPDRLETAILESVAGQDLAAVSRRAREFVEDNYSYQSAIEGYHELITERTPYSLSDPPAEPTQPIHVP